MADKAKADGKTGAAPEAPRPEEYRVAPYRKEDFVSSSASDRGKTASELFGHDPEAVDDKAMDALLGTSDEVVIRTAGVDGDVREVSGKQLRAATKEAVKAGVAKAGQEAAGEQEPEDPPPDEAKADEPAPEPEAAAKPETEPEGDEPKKEPSKRQRRRDARYRAMEARAVAAEAKIAEYEKLQSAPAPAEAAAADEIPKAADYDDDDKHAEAVKAWADQRLQARDAAHAERVRLAATAGAAADGKALSTAAARDFNAIAEELYTPAQRAATNAELAKIESKALPGNAVGSLPVTRFMVDRRAEIEAAGGFGDDSKTTGEFMADMYSDPKIVAAMENLTGNGHILAGLAGLDDPLPVIRYLSSDEGKTKVDDLNRLSAARPEAVAARVVQIAHQALLNGAAAPGEPARVEPEITRAPRPGNSPRAAARTQASARKPAPNRADYGDLDPDLQAQLDAVLNPRSGGHLQPTG